MRRRRDSARKQQGATAFLAASFLLVCLFSRAADAAEIRYHGMPLDGKYRLRLEEEQGTVTVKLLNKDRAAGGPTDQPVSIRGKTEPIIRLDTEEALVRIRVEVLRPAAPNYVRNPGQRYRISMEGLSVAPDYARVFEVDAEDVLDAVYSEFVKLSGQTYGIRRDALHYGGLVAMKVLNEAQYLPAELPMTTRLSRVGKIGIKGPFLERSGQELLPLQSAGKSGTGREVSQASKGGQVEDLEVHRARSWPAQLNAEEAYRPVQPALGRPGRPLTAQEKAFPPTVGAHRENIEILLGPDPAPLGSLTQYEERSTIE